MKRSGKIILSILVIGLIIGSFVLYNIWYKPHRDVADETAVNLSAQQLINEFNGDETKANSLYLDKVIAVSGTVSDVTKTAQGKTVVSLKTDDPMAGVRCTMKEDISPEPGSTVKIKGICTGFLMDVTLIDCVISE